MRVDGTSNSMWRYKDALPFMDEQSIVAMGEQ